MAGDNFSSQLNRYLCIFWGFRAFTRMVCAIWHRRISRAFLLVACYHIRCVCKHHSFSYPLFCLCKKDAAWNTMAHVDVPSCCHWIFPCPLRRWQYTRPSSNRVLKLYGSLMLLNPFLNLFVIARQKNFWRFQCNSFFRRKNLGPSIHRITHQTSLFPLSSVLCKTLIF